MAHPYDEFKKAGFAMTFASPKGGVAPVDEGSVAATAEDASCVAFWASPETKVMKVIREYPQPLQPREFYLD